MQILHPLGASVQHVAPFLPNITRELFAVSQQLEPIKGRKRKMWHEMQQIASDCTNMQDLAK
jgi:hypothetical protein